MKWLTLTQKELLNTVAGGEKYKLENTEIDIDQIQIELSRMKNTSPFLSGLGFQ